ncbi:hypothetical protein APE01nite_18570 [Acetobacter peroxydans]|uniref:Uncharacterized protein n=1 Tax=Acetobacter peroxydans TaxID=104098 RepID=A0A4Y3TYH1_9PROT|nr:hypothetical protein AA13755_0687 [Acetobacter peroxydans NBRC 13755]GEB86060.1 hypothetical protein APE01nite_18570 [Acetobacter peroxydans]
MTDRKVPAPQIKQPVADVQIRAADATGIDPHQNFSFARRGNGDGAQAERFAGFDEPRGTHNG